MELRNVNSGVPCEIFPRRHVSNLIQGELYVNGILNNDWHRFLFFYNIIKIA